MMGLHQFSRRRWGIVVVSVLLMGSFGESFAQSRSTYTVLHAGGIYGLYHSQGEKKLSGYQFQFIFGRSFREQTYVGLGLGNDVYRQRTRVNDQLLTRRVNTLPIFVDFRQMLGQVSPLGRVGVMANAGYAPSLGSDYYQGGLGRLGLVYTHLLADRSDVQITLGGAVQQFDARYVETPRFYQYNVFLTLGLFVY